MPKKRFDPADYTQFMFGAAGLVIAGGVLLKNMASPFHFPMTAIGGALGFISGVNEARPEIKRIINGGSADDLAAAMRKIVSHTLLGVAFALGAAAVCDRLWIILDKNPLFAPVGLGFGALWGLKRGRKAMEALPPSAPAEKRHIAMARKFVCGALIGLGIGVFSGSVVKDKNQILAALSKATETTTSWVTGTYKELTEKHLPTYLKPTFEKGSTVFVIQCDQEKTGQSFLFKTRDGEKTLSCDGKAIDATPKRYDFEGTPGTGVLLFDKNGKFKTLKLQ